MRVKDRAAIPANLYRIKQIDCPCESAKYRLRDRRRKRAVTLGTLFLDLHRRDRNLSNHPNTFLSLCPLQFPKMNSEFQLDLGSVLVKLKPEPHTR